MKIQKSTFSGLAVAVAALAAVLAKLGGGEQAPALYSTIASVITVVGGFFGGMLFGSDGGIPKLK
jgi:hypothetical protein